MTVKYDQKCTTERGGVRGGGGENIFVGMLLCLLYLLMIADETLRVLCFIPVQIADGLNEGSVMG